MGDGVRYFAYGSNMQAATLRGRRGIEPRSARAARIGGWRLVFDKPGLIAIGEGFANIVSDPSGAVVGVLYELTLEDFDHVEVTEGVRIGNYKRVDVQVTTLEGGGALEAVSLSSDRRDPSLLPSSLYMGLLIEGALEHGLPSEYVEWLRAVPARDPSAESLEWRAMISGALRRRP